MKIILMIITACFISYAGFTQATDSIEFKVLDPPAQFPGGYQAFYKFLGNNLIYPEGKDVKGKVYVQFVIGTDGVIEESSIRTLSKSELERMNTPTDDLIEDEAISLEAIRVIKLCPDWNPGLYNGVPSRQRMVVPLVFAR